jgi:glycosyltransferase involved in cell wall biosynthesis
MESCDNSFIKTIVYLDHTACLGGGEIALLNLINALDKQRYKPIVVLGCDGPFADQLKSDGIQVHIEPLDDSVLETRKDSLGFRSLLALRRIGISIGYSFRITALVKRLHADLIHTNSLKADVYGGIAGRLAGIPVIWHIRDNISTPYLPASIASFFRILAKCIPTHVVTNSKSTLKTLRFNQGSCSCNSSTNQEPGFEHYPVPGKRQRGHVVYCGCVTENFDSPLREQQENAPVTLVGRIAEWKGQHIFIQAAAEVLKHSPNTRFQIVGAPLFGEEEYEQELHRMTETLKITENVAFLGFRKDIPELLSASAMVVHASTIGEPFGQVVVEAMAAGRPVIATSGGALPEIVVDGETGLLVPMNDPTAMARAILELLSNRDCAEKLGVAARIRVRRLFSIDRTARNTEAIYDSIFSQQTTLLRKLRSVA